ncbi:MAG TPA: phytanoyl-CoA dioxygenase family protein [Pyrinomonadaceae bacterium]|nr:phytanoyl-CoA dioxygenase family protein [Pyrinomonadaceae bacterium]
MNTDHIAADLERDGFAILDSVVDDATVARLLQLLTNVHDRDVHKQRAGKAFGIRNLLNVVPLTRNLADSSATRSIVEPVLGSSARVVRGIYFDKHRDANWKVAWHQDLTIAVQERVDVDGYGPWSIKAGIHHVQPPVIVLENMLAVRIHLDHADESNGALRVLPGTHLHGRLDVNEIQYWKEQRQAVTCTVKRGGAMLMSPLLLHASSPAVDPRHRRVLHFEYSSIDLPGGLRWFEQPLSDKLQQ